MWTNIKNLFVRLFFFLDTLWKNLWNKILTHGCWDRIVHLSSWSTGVFCLPFRIGIDHKRHDVRAARLNLGRSSPRRNSFSQPPGRIQIKGIWSLFHQVSISSTFYLRIFRTNIVFLVMFWLCHKNSYKKIARLTLMKLTAGLKKLNST